jgi:hypothetical protein
VSALLSPEKEGRSILRNALILKVSRFLGLFISRGWIKCKPKTVTTPDRYPCNIANYLPF